MTMVRHTFTGFTVYAVAALCAAGARDAAAQTESFPIDGAGGASISCVNDATVQKTGRPFGSSPSTITGCTLAGDTPFSLGQLPYTVYCKGGNLIQFYSGTKNLKSCSLAYDTAYLQNSAGAQVPCKAGVKADFEANGRLISCTGPQATGSNTGLFQPIRPPTTGGPPVAPPQSIFSYAAPATPLDASAYAQRSREFVESALDGDYARALRLASDRFKREIGEKGLAYFRDFVSKQGPAQFIAQEAFEDNGYTVVVGALALPNRRTMVVHVLFLNGQVEHLFERWGRR